MWYLPEAAQQEIKHQRIISEVPKSRMNQLASTILVIDDDPEIVGIVTAVLIQVRITSSFHGFNQH
jgi:hypothetical protein